MTGQSYELTKFYRAYKAWLDAGAPHREPFSRRLGLCHNISNWLDSIYKSEDYRLLRNELEQQLEQADMHWNYPFGGSYLYNEECRSSTMHLNRARIAWVTKHA